MTQVAAAPATGAIGTAGRRERRLDRWTLALAAVSAGLVGLGWGLGWRGVDMPAQLFRVDQFRAYGFSLWDSQWYSGHWTLDYSVLYPALGALVGVGWLAALSAALATCAFDRILVAAFGPAGRLGSAVFAVSVIVETSIGQLAFFTGMAFALSSVWALLGTRRRWVVAGVLALASSATSPLAGAFLALAMAGWFLSLVVPRRLGPADLPRRSADFPRQSADVLGRSRDPRPTRALCPTGNPRPGGEVEAAEFEAIRWGEGWRLGSIGVLALLPIAVTGVLFPGQGPMPYPVIDWLWETVIALLVWTVAPRGLRALRIGVGLYLLALLGSVSVPSALGGNIGRMEDAFALPVVAACCWSSRDAEATAWPLGRWVRGRVAPAALTKGFRVALVGLAVPLVFSQWGPAWQALTANAGRSWTHRGYYAPLTAWLTGELEEPPAARVEVVPTLDHWEADYVAPSVPLARGWDRQLDEADNPLFYGKTPLTAQSYLAWLKADGVRYVALAGAPLDSAGVAEARLLGAGVPGLRVVWHDADWRVWEVVGGPGIVTGPARLTAISGGTVELDATAAGAVEVRVRWAAHWRLASGAARLAEASGGWTTVMVERAGPVRLRAHLGW